MSGAAAAPKRPSIRSVLMRRVMPPLVLTWALGTIATTSVASYLTEQAFDSALLDDAYVIASRIEAGPHGLTLEMTPADIKTVLFDQTETIDFAVRTADGGLVAGRPEIDFSRFGPDDVSVAEIGTPVRAMRGLILRRTVPARFSVVVAQTTSNRHLMLQRLLFYSVLPQVVLLLALAWWLERAIRKALAPLSDLQRAVDRRDAADLEPLPALLTGHAATLDVMRLGTALNALMARIGDSIQAQREFAGNVAHELRTPLAGIRAVAEYGLSQSDPGVWREQLQAVIQSQLRASHLVDQLLAIALAHEAQGGLRISSVDLSAVARDMIFQFLPHADSQGVDLGASGLELPLHVQADPALVEGILGNLIDNALRYGTAGAGIGQVVTVDLQASDSSVRLSVIDNGRGISAEQRNRIVLRWAQGPAGQSLGVGAGLGLAIVARYAELMNAKFEIGGGTNGVGAILSVVFNR